MENKNDHLSELDPIKSFAGRAAHDFNNALTGILGFAQLILMDMKEDDKYYSDVKQIEKAAKKGKTFTDQLLIFSQKKPLVKKETDINGMIESVIYTVKDSLKPDVLIKADLNEVPLLSLDDERISQALINIVMNCGESMEDKGEILFSTGMSEDGKHVVINISDNGRGADPEDISKIFEPFYKTKQARDMGVRLVTAYDIVKTHGGGIDAFPRDGGGLTLKIRLPVAKAAN